MNRNWNTELILTSCNEERLKINSTMPKGTYELVKTILVENVDFWLKSDKFSFELSKVT